MSEVRSKLAMPAAPAMPLYATIASALAAGDRERNDTARAHQDHVANKCPSENWFGLVRTPVPIPKALKIPEAREALKEEWDKLERTTAWNLKAVKPKAQVIAEAKKEGRSVHFGSLMELCSIKNSQLGKEFWSCKGRLVFRGDIVKDENGQFAVFTEQGASASHMSAAKFMDALSRLPGNSGEDSDAVGAYTQVSFAEAAKLWGNPNVVTETWISLPPHKRTNFWDKSHDPACPLLLNLYGHPLAGLLWEKYQEATLFRLELDKIKSWECLYVNRPKSFSFQPT